MMVLTTFTTWTIGLILKGDGSTPPDLTFDFNFMTRLLSREDLLAAPRLPDRCWQPRSPSHTRHGLTATQKKQSSMRGLQVVGWNPMDPLRELEDRRRVYIGTSGHVVCVDQAGGAEIWRTAIRRGSGLTTLLHRRGRIYAGCQGAVVCLDRAAGDVLWHTRIKDLLAPVALSLDEGVPGGLLVVAGKGLLFGLAGEHGTLIWTNELKGLGYSPICVLAPHAVVAQPAVQLVSSGKSTRVEPTGFSQTEPEEP
jgi:hypothetical protein